MERSRTIESAGIGASASIISTSWVRFACIINHTRANEELYMGILDELLGGGQRQKEYRDFVDRYEQGKP
ncbi:MAG: hypothetical protein WBV76_14580, partial [Pseudolabrys sp.]